MPDVNPTQITFARVRRRLSKAKLANKLGITVRTLQNYENGTSSPDALALTSIASALSFPVNFFFIEEDMPMLKSEAVSFRRHSKMTESMRACAFSVGAIGFKFNEWLEDHFNLPIADLPDLSDLPPEEAAATLRRIWKLGNAPIPNMIHLLESKGIRVFSLAEETRDVDAFCTWYENTPYVFLNTVKSAERSRFDAAHELGHLVRDIYTMQHGEAHGPEMERQADAFASAFLMPKESIVTTQPPAFTVKYLLKIKHQWGVSLAALAYRLKTLNLVSEWSYRNLCIEISTNGFRTNEPEPMNRETSKLLSKVMDVLHSKNQGWREVAERLCLSLDELNALTFQLTNYSVINGGSRTSATNLPKPNLRIVGN